MPNPIRVLTVDAAGTLVQPWPSVGAVYAKTARKHGIEINDKQVDKRFYEVLGQAQKNNKITLGEEKDFWREVVTLTFKPFAKGQNIDAIFENLWDLFAEGEHWRIAENAESTLKTLRSRGYRLAVLSNNDSRLRSVLEDHNMTSLFDEIFISAELGFEKPDRDIFRAVEDKMKEKPDRFLHLGDSYSRDFVGAQKAGWSAILYGLPIIEKSQITSFSQLLDHLP
ncbi:MAG: HAD-IA family hydrolase [Opitutales bacterium]|nr:HAD-IA family hydrolase [Opitutales bacterium]